MSQQKLLEKVIRVLDQAGIEYMITGSVASSLQGEPRSTHDIDMVVTIEESKAPELAGAFPAPDFYLDEQSIVEAIAGPPAQSMFNLIELDSGDKVDFWILSSQDFDRTRFSRRIRQEFEGFEMQLSSPEDTILSKLRWAKLSGGSEKQFVDALGVYEVQYGKLDLDYLDRWAKKLEVDCLWQRLKAEAQTS